MFAVGLPRIVFIGELKPTTASMSMAPLAGMLNVTLTAANDGMAIRPDPDTPAFRTVELGVGHLEAAGAEGGLAGDVVGGAVVVPTKEPGHQELAHQRDGHRCLPAHRDLPGLVFDGERRRHRRQTARLTAPEPSRLKSPPLVNVPLTDTSTLASSIPSLAVPATVAQREPGRCRRSPSRRC